MSKVRAAPGAILRMMAVFSSLAFALAFGAIASAQTTSELGDQIDLTQPIEINADSLEVRRNESIAIFDGNVDAKQGEIRLQANQVKVHYRPASDRSSDGGISGSISKLDAVGDVFISSPRETARGETGVYEVEKQQITLDGDVILTQGKNVLRGQSLVIDLASGVTKLKGPKRIRGIFTPEKRTKN